MDSLLQSLLEGLDSSIKELGEKEAESKIISDYIENEDFEGLKNLLTSAKIDVEEYKSEEIQSPGERNIQKDSQRKNNEISHAKVERKQSLREDDFFDYDRTESAKMEIQKRSYKNMEEKAIFYNNESCIDRLIRKIEWNSDNPNNFMAIYEQKRNLSDKHPPGLVLLWDANNSDKNSSQPIYTMNYTNTIASISFVKNNPSLVVGGTSTGRVVVWDTRTSRKTPISISPSSQIIIGNADIICLKVTQSEFFSPIMGILSNGRICKWKLSMLSAPEEIVFEGSSKKHGNAICGDIINTADDICVYGTHSGNLIKVDPYLEEGQKATILSNLKFPITSIDFHKCNDESSRLPLFISTCLDGSLRIWNSQKSSQIMIDNKFNNSFIGAKWCPTHPALYSTADCLGIVKFCNAIKSSVPFCQYKSEKQKLFTCLSWSPIGTTLLLGKTDGRISAIHVDEKLISHTKDDASKLNSFAERITTQDDMYIDKSETMTEDSLSRNDADFSQMSTTLLSESLSVPYYQEA